MIQAWLNSSKRKYIDGVELYAKFGNNSTLLGLFRKSESVFNKQKLFDELSKIAEIQEPQKSPEKKTEVEHAPAKPKLKRGQFTADEITAPIFELKLSAFKKMSALHQNLCAISGNSPKAVQERYKIQNEIVQLDALNEECWSKIHYYNVHGELPPTNELEFNCDNYTIRDLVNMEKVIPTYVTKYNNQLKEPGIEPNRISELNRLKADWLLKLQTIKDELSKLPKLGKLKEVLNANQPK
jgi:hypothetical protein